MKTAEDYYNISVLDGMLECNKEKLRQAVRKGYITQKNENGIWYDLNSLSDEFKVKRSA